MFLRHPIITTIITIIGPTNNRSDASPKSTLQILKLRNPETTSSVSIFIFSNKLLKLRRFVGRN